MSRTIIQKYIDSVATGERSVFNLLSSDEGNLLGEQKKQSRALVEILSETKRQRPTTLSNEIAYNFEKISDSLSFYNRNNTYEIIDSISSMSDRIFYGIKESADFLASTQIKLMNENIQHRELMTYNIITMFENVANAIKNAISNVNISDLSSALSRFLDGKSLTTAQSNIINPLFSDKGTFFVQNINEQEALYLISNMECDENDSYGKKIKIIAINKLLSIGNLRYLLLLLFSRSYKKYSEEILQAIHELAYHKGDEEERYDARLICKLFGVLSEKEEREFNEYLELLIADSIEKKRKKTDKANAERIHKLNKHYSKNRYSVFFDNYGRTIIDSADPATFEIFELLPYISKDHKNVYYGDKIIVEAEAKTFSLFKGNCDKVLKDIHYHYFGKDNKCIFYFGRDNYYSSKDKYFIVKEADPETFQHINGKYAKDRNNVFLLPHTKLEKANPHKFIIHDKDITYDDRYVYFRGSLINSYKGYFKEFKDARNIFYDKSIVLYVCRESVKDSSSGSYFYYGETGIFKICEQPDNFKLITREFSIDTPWCFNFRLQLFADKSYAYCAIYDFHRMPSDIQPLEGRVKRFENISHPPSLKEIDLKRGVFKDRSFIYHFSFGRYWGVKKIETFRFTKKLFSGKFDFNKKISQKINVNSFCKLYNDIFCDNINVFMLTDEDELILIDNADPKSFKHISENTFVDNTHEYLIYPLGREYEIKPK